MTIKLRQGGKYNWKHAPSDKLTYMGTTRYFGDRRTWHQFARVEEPGKCWCEVLESDLEMFEETKESDGK